MGLHSDGFWKELEGDSVVSRNPLVDIRERLGRRRSSILVLRELMVKSTRVVNDSRFPPYV